MVILGHGQRRIEDPPLLGGESSFVADLAGGAQRVVFVRSPCARGALVGIELPAEGLVITAADLGSVGSIEAKLNKFAYISVKQPVLASGRVQYVGQAIAAVVGETEADAWDLADQVVVEIDPEEPEVDAHAAIISEKAPVHEEASDNVLVLGELKTPGVDDVMMGAAHRVDFDVRSRRQSALPLETRGAVAVFDRASGRTKLYASVQMPHMLRTGIADCLGMPEADLQVVAPEVGGGFGQKMSLFPEYIVLVWLAQRHRGRFAWIEDRRENLTAAAHSRDQHHRVRASFDVEGRLQALHVDVVANVGAFSCYPVTCGVEPLMALAEFPGPYNFQQYAARVRGVTTNTCPMAPYRGVSRPAITFAMERMFDRAAKTMGLDAVEIRRRNLVREFPHRTPTGLELDPGSYVEALERAAREIDIPCFRERQSRAAQSGRRLGLGLAVFNERSGYGTSAFAARGMDIVPGFERVQLIMTPGGEVEARVGAAPHGQGLKTTLSQIIAATLGIEIGKIRIIAGDTDRTPYGWGTFASRSLVVSGGATKLAAEKLADKIRNVAARMLQANVGEIELVDGIARASNGGSVELSAVARIVYHQNHQVADLVGHELGAVGDYDPAGTFSNACHAAIVEVDVETGAVQIHRYVVVEDAGRLVNPMIVAGQIQGGVAQGIANALFEEVIYDEDGNILTSTLADYLPPTAAEIPEIEIYSLHTSSDATLLDAKGLGEGGAIGAPAAIVNAICDALSEFGIEIDEIPATPERIREYLARAGQ